MLFKNLLFSIKDGVAKITLNRPEANNSINLDMAKELCDVAIHCSENEKVRAMLLTATGDIFCPGGDVKSFASEGKNLPDYLKAVTSYLHLAVSCFTRAEAPVMVAVNGVAAGAGMSLACGGDIVLAAESSRFTMAYTRIGLSPDGGATYFLPRIVGLKRALELALNNRQLSAHEALELGIVTQVLPDSELQAQAEITAKQVASGATKAFGAVKRLMHSGVTTPLETQMEFESQSLVNMSRTADAQEAMAAFVQKRAPNLQGK